MIIRIIGNCQGVRKGEGWVVKPHLPFGGVERPRSYSVNTISMKGVTAQENKNWSG